MAREIDLSKPLSKEDKEYLLSRHTVEYVDRVVAIAGETKSASRLSEEDLIGERGSESDFDPGKHTVEEVNEYLASASAEEKERVLAAEKDGRARSTIVGS